MIWITMLLKPNHLLNDFHSLSEFKTYFHSNFQLINALPWPIRFCVFMHDKTKEQLLLENYGNREKQEFIELVSTPGYEYLPALTENRFIKTHLPFSLMPPSVMEFGSKVRN